MNRIKLKTIQHKRRKRSIRRNIFGVPSRPRLTVFRSAKHIYAQLVDPAGKTLGTVSSRSKALAGEGSKVDAAKRVGQALAELAREKQVEQAVFNRNGFLYHGRVRALAEAAREAGLKF